MTADGNPNEQNFEDASAQLNEGLRSCRAVTSGYRALLSDEGREEPAQTFFNDIGDAGEEAA